MKQQRLLVYIIRVRKGLITQSHLVRSICKQKYEYFAAESSHRWPVVVTLSRAKRNRDTKSVFVLVCRKTRRAVGYCRRGGGHEPVYAVTGERVKISKYK